MYVVTNREIEPRRDGLDVFGGEPNRRGPNELRFVKVERQNGDWRMEVIPDHIPVSGARALRDRFSLDIDPRAFRQGSLQVACDIYGQARSEGRNVVIYVHGYNNDLRDIVETAERIEQDYGAICLVFSWPASGGGMVSGTAAFLVDKTDARVSMDALTRFVGKLEIYTQKFMQSMQAQLWMEAESHHPDNPERARALYAELFYKQCETKLSLVCHGMGNYVLRCALEFNSSMLERFVFDNVVLLAADVDNECHAGWVEKIKVRNRLYITINEADRALNWPRSELVDQVPPQLGAHRKNLVARNAYYIDVTRTKGVGEAHGYFVDDAVKENAALKAFFLAAFNGGRAEDALLYEVDSNAYRVP